MNIYIVYIVVFQFYFTSMKYIFFLFLHYFDNMSPGAMKNRNNSEQHNAMQ